LGGYVLRELLAAHHDVVEYSRSAPRQGGVEFISGDIFEEGKLTKACRDCGAVIHMAAVPAPGRALPADLINVNVVGTIHALEAARAAGVPRFIFASSGAATGFSYQKHPLLPRYLPIDEEHPSEPHDDYGLSKLLAEGACKRYSDAFGMQTVCLRVNHNWYVDRPGAEMAVGTGWAGNLASVEDLWRRRYWKVLEDPDGEWPIPGPPPPLNLLWAVTDARDAAQAFRLAAEKDSIRHEVLLINSDDTCSFEETLVLLQRHFPDVPLKKKLQGHASLVSHARASQVLGYSPRYSWRKSDFRDWMEQVK